MRTESYMLQLLPCQENSKLQKEIKSIKFTGNRIEDNERTK